MASTDRVEPILRRTPRDLARARELWRGSSTKVSSDPATRRHHGHRDAIAEGRNVNVTLSRSNITSRARAYIAGCDAAERGATLPVGERASFFSAESIQGRHVYEDIGTPAAIEPWRAAIANPRRVQ